MHFTASSWRWVVPATLALAAAAVCADESQPAPVDQANRALWWGDFDSLTRLNDAWRQPGQREATGLPKTAALREAFRIVFDGPERKSETYFLELRALTLEWTRQHPRSGLAHALHARAMREHAWYLRGTGYSHTVPAAARAEFRRLLQEAADHLQAHADVAFSDAATHHELIDIGRGLGWDDRAIWQLVEGGLKRQPEAITLFSAALIGRLPKWGGSDDGLDRFIRQAVASTRGEWGMGLYALLYDLAEQEQYEHSLFDDSAIRWRDMKQGWQDLVQRYPVPHHINRYARYACMAKDLPAYQEMMGRLDGKPALEHWGRNASRDFALCRSWASRT